MGEDAKIPEFEPVNEKDLSNDRILKILVALILVGTVVTALLVSVRSGAGFFIGGLCSFINYYWMKRSLAGFFESAREGKAPGFVGIRFILRYLLFGVLIAIVYITDVLPVIAVLVGVTGFALAVFIDGLISIFRPVEV